MGMRSQWWLITPQQVQVGNMPSVVGGLERYTNLAEADALACNPLGVGNAGGSGEEL